MPNLVKIERRTRDAYVTRHQAQAREAFERHQIRHRDTRSWVCFRPHKDGGWDHTFWFEAVVLYGGTLLVNGDIDLVHFAYYGKYQDPEQVLRWIGCSRDLGYYVRQKACIGMTLAPEAEDRVVTLMDEDVWMDDALAHIEEEVGGLNASEGFDIDALNISGWLRDLITSAAAGHLHEALHDAKSNNDAWDAGVFEWGRLPSPRLIYAHEALRRLVQLLDAERAKTEEVADAG